MFAKFGKISANMKKKEITIVILFLVLVIGGYKLISPKLNGDISLKEAQAKITELINLNPNNTAVVKNAIEENGLYKITVVADNQELFSYLSKDGKKFFPQVVDFEEFEQARANALKPVVSPQSKSDKPSVELFVMSYCPFGLQIEKGILPVLKTLGSKIDFELKFCDYAMHDKKELDEQTQQYCLQKQGLDKLLNYLNCFLKEGASAQCLASIEIDKSALRTCLSETDIKYKITEQYNDKNTWRGQFPVFDVDKEDNLKYGVAGSPALIINGEEIAGNRDAKSLLGAICSGFKNPPQECQQELSSQTPSRGFGFSSASNNTQAQCAD